MLGLLGGGQLGRMFVMAAHQMGYQVMVLDPDADSPAGRIAEQFLCKEYTDQTALQQLGTRCAAVTTEFENIPADVLSALASYSAVSPNAESVAIAQNRIAEKRFLQTHGFPVAPFAVIDKIDCVDEVKHLFPGILKVSQFGYDGKGQRQVSDADELHAAFVEMRSVPCVLEKKLPLKSEVSIVLTRGCDGAMASFPVVENQHVSGVLDISIAPARIATMIAKQANDAAESLAEILEYQGVLCVEFFVLEGEGLIINEIAPRPHNSGHYTVDACITSQFEQQLRALCGLPLGNAAMHHSAVMVNLLGDLWQKGEPEWLHVIKQPLAKLHLYGKKAARPGRKMGHFTVLGATVDEAFASAREIQQQLESV
ncbi:5-(carboxyamino)imidazole ribonucleotide synthase [Nitrosomonas sp. Nm51]|nr:5-(carboxyamino)imidazole ribonucleotide synthase [Nitrosomonas sp. Nm51]